MIDRDLVQAARDHIDSVTGKPCAWGVDDCTAWAALWVKARRGIDLGLPVYRTREQAHAIINRAGGLVNLWSQYLSRGGIFEARYADYGHIGVIDTKIGPVGVIVLADGVCAWRAERGVHMLRPREYLKIWAV